MVTPEHLDHEKLVEVTVTHNEVEANIIKSLLEGSGIDCVLVTQVPHGVYPVNVDGLGEIRIKVLDSEVEAAKAVIQDYENTALDEKESEE